LVISTLPGDLHVVPAPFPTQVFGMAAAVGAATIAIAAAPAASSGVT